ncbi:Yip1 family protein [Candidatus Oscillochloris fontis]|uniref:Yip1 family protein n=1 Tax=Candidatus Oscillochloris fontis TaxID=2496868 RepID=UPI00101D41C7|nr:Yip1 family protein [Candidatus Oscillochloris fontis]
MMDTFNGALTLNQNLLRGMRESPDVVRRGLMLVLLVGLLVGTVQAISTSISNANTSGIVAQVELALDESIEQQALSATTEEQRVVIGILRENKPAILDLVQTIINLPTPTPRPVGLLFHALGMIVSTPLSYLGSLLLAVVFAHIGAQQLGGTGNIRQMLGMGALSVAPHALDALSFIPVFGATLSLIAWAWGLVILIMATSVAHRLDSGKATIAVLVYPLVGGLVLMLSCCILFFMSVALG